MEYRSHTICCDDDARKPVWHYYVLREHNPEPGVAWRDYLYESADEGAISEIEMLAELWGDPYAPPGGAWGTQAVDRLSAVSLGEGQRCVACAVMGLADNNNPWDRYSIVVDFVYGTSDRRVSHRQECSGRDPTLVRLSPSRDILVLYQGRYQDHTLSLRARRYAWKHSTWLKDYWWEPTGAEIDTGFTAQRTGGAFAADDGLIGLVTLKIVHRTGEYWTPSDLRVIVSRDGGTTWEADCQFSVTGGVNNVSVLPLRPSQDLLCCYVVQRPTPGARYTIVCRKLLWQGQGQHFAVGDEVETAIEAYSIGDGVIADDGQLKVGYLDSSEAPGMIVSADGGATWQHT
jgi:hypothetical protein